MGSRGFIGSKGILVLRFCGFAVGTEGNSIRFLCDSCRSQNHDLVLGLTLFDFSDVGFVASLSGQVVKVYRF
jgi:hypothetical protein